MKRQHFYLFLGAVVVMFILAGIPPPHAWAQPNQNYIDVLPDPEAFVNLIKADVEQSLVEWQGLLVAANAAAATTKAMMNN